MSLAVKFRCLLIGLHHHILRFYFLKEKLALQIYFHILGHSFMSVLGIVRASSLFVTARHSVSTFTRKSISYIDWGKSHQQINLKWGWQRLSSSYRKHNSRSFRRHVCYNGITETGKQINCSSCVSLSAIFGSARMVRKCGGNFICWRSCL